jgi:hypothetical protein
VENYPCLWGSFSFSGFRMRAGGYGKNSSFPLQLKPELSKKRKQQLAESGLMGPVGQGEVLRHHAIRIEN